MRGFVGGMGQILAWMVWVDKILAWVKKNCVGPNFGVGRVGQNFGVGGVCP